MGDRHFTDADIAALATALKGHGACTLGLTAEEVSTLKRLLKAFDAAAGVIGKVVLTAIMVAIMGWCTKGFWLALTDGVKAVGGGK